MSEWISVNDRLPPESVEVLVFCKFDNSPLIAHHSYGVWHEKCDNIVIHGDAWYDTEIHEVVIGDTGYQITHWMPLPEPPK
jgi:hypothetical protein